MQELAADRLISYSRRLHQGRTGVVTGIPDLLQWWRVSAATYPVGHCIISIPVTRIPCERLFSTAVTARLASSLSSPQAVRLRTSHTPLSRCFKRAGMCERTLCECSALHGLPISRVWCRSSALVALVMISRYHRGLCHDIAIHKKSTIRALVKILILLQVTTERLRSASSVSLVVQRTRLSTIGDRVFLLRLLVCGTVFHHTSLLHLSLSFSLVSNPISSLFLVPISDFSLVPFSHSDL